MSKKLQAKLDSAAKALQPIFDKAMSEIDKQSWSCHTCGATTVDPEHMLIQYFHMNCPGK